MQERGDALPARDHGVDEAVVDIHGLKRRQPHLGDVRLLEDDVEQLVDLDMRVGRIDAVVGAEVHAGEDDLGDARALGAPHLFEHRGNRNGTLRPARLPHDAVRAAVVAAVLDLDTQARAAEQVGEVVPLVEVDRARGQARRVGGGAGDVDLGGLGNDPRRQVGELAGMPG